ncbi:MAG: hypothetical protein AAB495_02770 [Patescibacteria group bacterium]
MPIAPNYLNEIRIRKKRSRVYADFQLLGLEIAELLGDEEHKSLYIKMAKRYEARDLRKIAKEISQNKSVKNKGAYFMKIVFSEAEKK